MKTYTKEMCFEVAKKYKTRNEFRIDNVECYSICQKRGWLDSFDWMPKPKRYTLNSIKELGCKNRSELVRTNPSAYNCAYRNNWLDILFPPPRKKGTRLKYTFEKCLELRKQVNTKTEFRLLNPSAYQTAYSQNWLNLLFA